MGGHGWPGPPEWPKVGRLVRRMSHRVDPAAIAEEARTVRLDAVLGPPRRSGDLRPTPWLRTWIRTMINGVRVRDSGVELSPTGTSVGMARTLTAPDAPASFVKNVNLRLLALSWRCQGPSKPAFQLPGRRHPMDMISVRGTDEFAAGGPRWPDVFGG